jgi:hypothetical protein
MRRDWSLALLVAAVASLGPSVRTAGAAQVEDPRLAARLAPQTAAEVSRLTIEARAAHLPVEPLIATALEGASRHAPDERIVAAVRGQLAAFREARAVLGGAALDAELVTAANALTAGLPGDSLAAVRAARPAGSLVVPLVVLADFLARGVPAATASSAVTSACRAGAEDADLMRMRERVERDLQAGGLPAVAPTVRARALALEMRGARKSSAQSPPGEVSWPEPAKKRTP